MDIQGITEGISNKVSLLGVDSLWGLFLQIGDHSSRLVLFWFLNTFHYKMIIAQLKFWWVNFSFLVT